MSDSGTLRLVGGPTALIHYDARSTSGMSNSNHRATEARQALSRLGRKPTRNAEGPDFAALE
jgi:hypothetical protein